MAKSTSKLFESETPNEMMEDAMNLPEEEIKEESKEEIIPAEKSETEENDIQDIDLSVIKRKRFRINGDNKKILELNTSDLNIISRLTQAYERLQKYMEEVGTILSALPDSDDEIDSTSEEAIRKQLDSIDSNMKKEIDYIFDAPVSAVCSDGGSMYDPFDGAFRYEHIIEAILRLYERNLDKEFNKMKKRVAVKTSKYTKKYHN